MKLCHGGLVATCERVGFSDPAGIIVRELHVPRSFPYFLWLPFLFLDSLHWMEPSGVTVDSILWLLFSSYSQMHSCLVTLCHSASALLTTFYSSTIQLDSCIWALVPIKGLPIAWLRRASFLQNTYRHLIQLELKNILAQLVIFYPIPL